MKKTLIAFILALALFASGQNTGGQYLPVDKGHAPVAVDSVYICHSGLAYAYHRDRHCTGLCQCQHGVGRVALTQAKKLGYKPCKVCCKKHI